MNTLAKNYCTIHRQGFVPIFVGDNFDAVLLAEAAVAAGAKAVEITCRRPTICDDIRRVRRQFPDLLVLVGSVVDEGPMYSFLKRRRPDMPTMAELADLDVHGFVSFMPISPESLARFSRTHILMPGVETAPEAAAAVNAGAHFVKFYNTSALGGPKRISLVSGGAMFGLLPIFVTGGVTLNSIGDFVKAGAGLLGAGWDLLLGDDYQALQAKPDVDRISADFKKSLDAMTEARRVHLGPDALSNDDEMYLAGITHYHCFPTTVESPA